MPSLGNTVEMTNRTQVRHKTTDAKGRVTLGGHFANRAVIVEHQSNDEVIVRLALVIPEREAWPYENPKALASVRRGLDPEPHARCLSHFLVLRPKEKRDYDYRQYAASVVIDPGCAGRNGKSDSAVNENASIDEDDPLPSFDL